jgi:hypothetical protein
MSETIPPSLVLITVGSVTGVSSARCSLQESFLRFCSQAASPP